MMMMIWGPHFLCWILGVVSFNTWLISSWEENKCCYKLRKCRKWHLFLWKWLKLSFWVKIVVILSVAQLLTTVIVFSAWDKSRVKWDNSQNSTQKMRTYIAHEIINKREYLNGLLHLWNIALIYCLLKIFLDFPWVIYLTCVNARIN